MFLIDDNYFSYHNTHKKWKKFWCKYNFENIIIKENWYFIIKKITYTFTYILRIHKCHIHAYMKYLIDKNKMFACMQWLMNKTRVCSYA